MNGVLLIDKPSGPTSFDLVRAVRKFLNVRKVGHAGTLDPIASGLLVVGVGQGTRLIPFLMEGEKRYIARVALGAGTDTDDSSGEVIERVAAPEGWHKRVSGVLKEFVGKIEQVPPVYSALKQNGVPLYKRVRRGEEVSPEAREVEIFSIEVTSIDKDSFAVDVRCGPGTYIRSLARDAANSLGTLGHIVELRRVETSGFSVDEAITVEDMEKASREGRLKERVISMAKALRKLPKVDIDGEAVEEISKGRALPLEGIPTAKDLPIKANVRLLDVNGNLVSIARIDKKVIQPVRVFV